MDLWNKASEFESLNMRLESAKVLMKRVIEGDFEQIIKPNTLQAYCFVRRHGDITTLLQMIFGMISLR